ncbi:hypothetical protein CLU81_0602 [Flavobacterium sp. 9]|uniref:hypothetical protein n=1 Tax=Flavobacterium sp. 9 TaxID=2035198 RepID=UPI000C1855B0|nr:hypothetical protein [Flavobacterium sp. 9]PIF30194.1 hypothetical protein CLU81_0602 [Flavobacterium sp. 9]
MEETYVHEFEFELNQTATTILKETAKWAYLLSIAGYVAVSLILLSTASQADIFSSREITDSEMSSTPSFLEAIEAFIQICVTALNFFPVYYLNKFAVNAKRAFRNNDSQALTNSFEYLKSHYKSIVIIMLITLVIFVSIVFVSLIATYRDFR